MDGKVNVWREYNKRSIETVAKYLEEHKEELTDNDVAGVEIHIDPSKAPQIWVKKVVKNG